MKSLKFENITFGYPGQKPIFQDLSFEISSPEEDKGHVTALMGASGAGKSTLLKLIMGTLHPNKGKIVAQPEKPVIAYLPQEPVLFEHLSPLQNARYFETTSFYRKRFDNALFEDLADSLNMREVLALSRSTQDLSGGQRQRLSLLRALSIRPDMLLLDEPTTGLDAEVKLAFLHKLREIVLRYKLLVVYVTHHKLETELVVDDIVYLHKDEKSGTIQRVFKDSLVNFVNHPPLMEAAKVFNYPKPNLLRCKVVDGEVRLAGNEEDETMMIDVKEKFLIFGDTGFQYRIIAQNPLFTLVELEDTKQLLTLNKTIQGVNNNQYLTLNGDFTIYISSGAASNNMYIQQNCIK